ncbi:hypothetical protein FVE85_4305 [Porphyridium purpureum]|uniref:Uncharacterized protein n=1 Tax=Porphyridium purpureum TaxID=35688 RepID=A0A5J4YTR7_PORPP|nr:hypothetical protein FVE85_4305 [Porphyridium purpureum]|eukprot:POR6212..scf229_5
MACSGGCELEKLLEETEHEVATKHAENLQLKVELQRAIKQIEQIKKEAQRADANKENDADGLQAKLNQALLVEKKQMASQLASAQFARDHAKKELAATLEQLEASQREKLAAQEELMKRKRVCDEAERECQKLRTDLEACTTAFEREIAELDEDLIKMKGLYDAAEAARKALEEQGLNHDEQLAVERENAVEKAKALEKTRADQQKQHDVLQEELAKTKSSQEGHMHESARLTQEVNLLRERNEELYSHVGISDARIAELQNQVQELDRARQTKEVVGKDLELELEGVKAAFSAASKAHDEACAALECMKVELGTERERVASFQSTKRQLEQAERENTHIAQELQKISAQLDKERTKSADLDLALNDTLDRKNGVEAELRHVLEQYAHLQSQDGEATARLEQMEAELMQMRHSSAELRDVACGNQVQEWQAVLARERDQLARVLNDNNRLQHAVCQSEQEYSQLHLALQQAHQAMASQTESLRQSFVQQMQATSAEYDAVEAERARLSTECDILRAQVDSTKATLLAELEAGARRVKTLEDEKSTLLQHGQDREEYEEIMRQEIAKSERRLDEVHAQVSALTKSLAERDEGLKLVRRESVEETRRLTDELKTCTHELDSFKARVAALQSVEAQNNSLVGQIHELSQQVQDKDVIQARCEELEAELAECRAQIPLVMSDMAIVRDRLTLAEERVVDLKRVERVCERLETQLREAQERVQSYDDLDRTALALKIQLAAVQEELEKAWTHAAAVDADLQKTRAEKERFAGEMQSEVEAGRAEHAEECSKLKAAVGEADAACAHLRQLLCARDQVIANLEASQNAMKKELEDTQHCLTGAFEERNKVMLEVVSLRQAEAQHKVLELEVKDLRARLEALQCTERKYEELKATEVTLNEQVGRLESEITSLAAISSESLRKEQEAQEALRRTVASLEEQTHLAETLEARVAALSETETKYTALASGMEALDKQLQGREIELAKVSEALTVAKQGLELAQLEADRRVQEHVDQTQHKLNQMEAEHSELVERELSLKQKVDLLDEELLTARRAMSSLERALADASAEESSIQASMKEEICSLQSRLDDTEQRASQAEESVKGATSEQLRIQEELDVARAELLSAQEGKAGLEQARDALQKKLQAAEAAVTASASPLQKSSTRKRAREEETECAECARNLDANSKLRVKLKKVEDNARKLKVLLSESEIARQDLEELYAEVEREKRKLTRESRAALKESDAGRAGSQTPSKTMQL